MFGQVLPPHRGFFVFIKKDRNVISLQVVGNVSNVLALFTGEWQHDFMNLLMRVIFPVSPPGFVYWSTWDVRFFTKREAVRSKQSIKHWNSLGLNCGIETHYRMHAHLDEPNERLVVTRQKIETVIQQVGIWPIAVVDHVLPDVALSVFKSLIGGRHLREVPHSL
jgi:hypothetical protein